MSILNGLKEYKGDTESIKQELIITIIGSGEWEIKFNIQQKRHSRLEELKKELKDKN